MIQRLIAEETPKNLGVYLKKPYRNLKNTALAYLASTLFLIGLTLWLGNWDKRIFQTADFAGMSILAFWANLVQVSLPFLMAAYIFFFHDKYFSEKNAAACPEAEKIIRRMRRSFMVISGVLFILIFTSFLFFPFVAYILFLHIVLLLGISWIFTLVPHLNSEAAA